MNDELVQPTPMNGLEIAIIGMAGRFPGAPSLDLFWNAVCSSSEAMPAIGAVPTDLQRSTDSTGQTTTHLWSSAVLEGIDTFDANFFGLSTQQVQALPPHDRIFLECVWESLEQANYDPASYQGYIGLYAGSNAYAGQSPPRHDNRGRFTTWVSQQLGLKGPSINLDTDHSTSLVAVHMACRSLQCGDCDLAVAGGITIIPHATATPLSPDDHKQGFDANARDTVVGSGVGVVVLKRLEDALADGDTILAVIKGSAVNHNGYADAQDGQAAAIQSALSTAEVDAETISYIEAHGTGSPLADSSEITALSKAFRISTPKTGFCAIGSVTTNFGHLDIAAGIAGLIKTVLALKHRQLPPSLPFGQPNPQIDGATSPFYVNATLRDWQTAGLPRRAGVSSFGIGGTNAHVILEEAPPVAPSVAPRHPAQLLLLSARTPSALASASANLAAHLAQHPELALADVAATLQLGRRAFRQRRALVVTDHAQAIAALRSDKTHSPTEALPQRPVVFLFPDQGTQYVGMGQDLYHSQPRFRAVVDQCAALLTPQLGLDLRSLLYPSGDATAAATRLAETDLGQVALFVVSYALAQQWMEWGVQPAAMIGQSLGEYVAACLAGVCSLEAALRLVVQRGRLMQAQPRGSMLAVSLPAAVLATRLPPEVTVAVETSAESCVVAGPSAAIAALTASLTREGVAHQPVATSHAFHSALMDGAVAGLTAAAAATPLAAPTIPYISSVSGTWITAAEATDAQYWGRQLRAPVRLATGLTTVASLAGAILLELGPGQTMSSQARRQCGSDQVIVASMRYHTDARDDVIVLLEALGQFWVAGGTVDWARFHADQPPRRVPLPTYPFERQRYQIAAPAEQEPPSHSPNPPAGKHPEIAEWFYVPSWQRTLVPRAATTVSLASATGSWLVLMDEQGLGATLVAKLRAAGATVVAVQAGSGYTINADGHYVVTPTAVADYQQLLHTLRAQGQLPSQILHLWGLASESSTTLRQGLESMVALIQALGTAEERGAMRWWVIGRDALEVESRDVVRPEQALVLGPCRVIPQEYAGMQCHYVDVAFTPGDAAGLARVADQVLAEVASTADEPVVAYRGAIRWVQSFEHVAIERSTGVPARLRPQGVYLITGGLGGIGLTLATYLARTVQAKLILVGRTTLPPRDEWDRWLAQQADASETSRKIQILHELEALGAEIAVLSADVADQQQMQLVLAEAKRLFGAIHGVIHAAGVQTGGMLQLKNQQEIDRVFTPKVYGTLTLAELLKDEPLDFLVLNSSLNAFAGEFGQVDDVAANTFLNAFASSYQAQTGITTLTINWDVWSDVGMARHAVLPDLPVLQEIQQTRLRNGIRAAEGQLAFEQILGSTATQAILVSPRNIATVLAEIQRIKAGNTEQMLGELLLPQEIRPRPDLSTTYVAARNETEQTIATFWEEIFGVDRIGVDDNFFELGGNSLLVIHLINRIRETFYVEIPFATFFEHPTVAGLAAVITEQEDDEKMEILKMLAELSDDDIDRLEEQFQKEE